jgi:hypothetical protein
MARRAPVRRSPAANTAQRFPDDIAAALDIRKGLRIRAGTGEHRFIGIWVVVVDGRVFVRSWSVTPQGWYRTFLAEPIGAIEIDGRELPVRAVRVRGARLNNAVDRAYLAKYDTPGSLKYAQYFGSRKSRATTIELRPLAARTRRKRQSRR